MQTERALRGSQQSNPRQPDGFDERDFPEELISALPKISETKQCGEKRVTPLERSLQIYTRTYKVVFWEMNIEDIKNF